jgi:DNA-directed RNA polymerase subunit K/omega
MDYKKIKAANNTIPRNLQDLEKGTDSIYETIAIVGKRAVQINKQMKEELDKKLEEFAYYVDNFEEIFENREQIEVSKYYERLPKPTLIALQEYLDDKIYFRNPHKEEQEETL